MSFSLYDALTGGTRVWGPESHTAVPVSSGLFSVGLGSQISGGIPTSAWNGDRYLEITVGSETLSPRELIRSVPIAGMALTVPNSTLRGEQLANTGFGGSNKPLMNFVPITPVTVLDLSNVGDRAATDLDLTPYTSPTAVAILLQIRVYDTGQASTKISFAVSGKGDFAGSFVNLRGHHLSGANEYENGIVLCDSSQTVQYSINATGSNTLDARITLTGYFEPASK